MRRTAPNSIEKCQKAQTAAFCCLFGKITLPKTLLDVMRWTAGSARALAGRLGAPRRYRGVR
eukprot:6338326-Alexandrium_andersonii.AAC.1